MVSEGKRHSLHSEHKLLIPATVLRSVVVKMHGAFPRLCKEWNVASCMRKNWARLFEHMDADGSGRLHFEEFLEATKTLGDIGATPRQLEALWHYIDHDESGEVSIGEFQHATYLLLLEGWVDYTKSEAGAAELKRMVSRINEAAVREYAVISGNWFKIFNQVDVDESGRVGYEELEAVMRSRDPGLRIAAAEISENQLRGLWKAIDADRSGDVTVEEFLTFMRAHGPSMHNLTNYAREKRGLEQKAAWRSHLLDVKEVKERKGAMARLRSAQRASQRGLPLWGAEHDGADGAPAPASGLAEAPPPPGPRPRRSRRAVQLAHLQWRRRVNEAKIRDAIRGKSDANERDFVRRFATNPKAHQQHWRREVINDELGKPLAVDSELLNRYEGAAALTHRQEAAEARRHASSLIWLDRRIRQREEAIVEDSVLFGAKPHPLDAPSTLGLMKGSFGDLKAKIERYGEHRFGREEWEALEDISS